MWSMSGKQLRHTLVSRPQFPVPDMLWSLPLLRPRGRCKASLPASPGAARGGGAAESEREPRPTGRACAQTRSARPRARPAPARAHALTHAPSLPPPRVASLGLPGTRSERPARGEAARRGRGRGGRRRAGPGGPAAGCGGAGVGAGGGAGAMEADAGLERRAAELGSPGPTPEAAPSPAQGPDPEDGARAWAEFAALHGTALRSSGVPERYWGRLLHKLEHEVRAGAGEGGPGQPRLPTSIPRSRGP